METLGQYHGLPGIFVAAILSASLSSISSGVNSIAAVILEDIYKRIITEESVSDKKQAIILKILCKFVYHETQI
jgi:Na+/proline symporter